MGLGRIESPRAQHESRKPGVAQSLRNCRPNNPMWGWGVRGGGKGVWVVVVRRCGDARDGEMEGMGVRVRGCMGVRVCKCAMVRGSGGRSDNGSNIEWPAVGR